MSGMGSGYWGVPWGWDFQYRSAAQQQTNAMLNQQREYGGMQGQAAQADNFRREYEEALRITGSTPIHKLPKILNARSKISRCDYCNGLHEKDTVKCQNCGAPR